MREVSLLASVACLVALAGCEQSLGDPRRGDAGHDAAATDASSARDAPSRAIDAGEVDASPLPDAFVDDAGTDAGPPPPVSCDRSGDLDCSPFTSTGRCPDGPSVFAADVNAAIDAVIAENPTWFDTINYPASTPLIQPANVSDYMQAVTDHLTAAGLCASGPGEELGVKRNADCSESWDLVANPDATTNLVRRHYVGDCFPAFF